MDVEFNINLGYWRLRATKLKSEKLPSVHLVPQYQNKVETTTKETISEMKFPSSPSPNLHSVSLAIETKQNINFPKMPLMDSLLQSSACEGCKADACLSRDFEFYLKSHGIRM